MAVFPRAQGRDPHQLPSRNLADAISDAQKQLNWTLKVGGRSELVPSPSQDVHYPVQSSQEAIGKWRDDAIAAQQLAAAARELLPHTGLSQAELASLTDTLERADLAVHAVSAPPDALPAAAEERAAIWQDLTRFHDAAGDLGRVVTQVLTAAFAHWQELIDPFPELLEQGRRLLQRNGGPDSELVTAVGRLEDAVREIPRPPAGLPATAAQVLDTARAMERMVAAQHKADREQSDLLKVAASRWDGWLADAASTGRAAARLLPYTGTAEADLRNRLNVAVPTLPALRGLSMDEPSVHLSMVEPSVQATWHALQRLADRQDATRDVLAAATDPNGLRSRVAAAPDLARAAGEMLPYTGEHQGGLQISLDEAYAQVKEAKPSWWLMSGPELTTVDDIEAARQWLAGDGPDRLLGRGPAPRRRHHRSGQRREPDGGAARTPGQEGERAVAGHRRAAGRPGPAALQGRRYPGRDPVHRSAVARAAAGHG